VRKAVAILVVVLGACSVDTDSTNEQVTLEYNKTEMRKAARDAGRTAREVASGVGNVAATTGRAISNEVGDIDVDVDVRRNRRTREEPAQRK
jgi:type IV secretory pathway TrbL component